MRLSVVLHENGGYQVYGKDIERIPQNIHGEYFYFDPRKKEVLCSVTREKSDRAGRDTQFTVAGQLEQKEVESLLSDPFQIHVLKQFLLQLSAEDAKQFAGKGISFQDEYLQNQAEAFRAEYPFSDENQETILGMVAAIVESAGEEPIALVLQAEEHTLYAALRFVPKNLRSVAFCAPCCIDADASAEYGVINLAPKGTANYSDFSTGSVKRFSISGIQKQEFYRVICAFFQQHATDAELQKRFSAPEFVQTSPKDAAQAILKYCDVLEKQKEYSNAGSQKEKVRSRYLKEIQGERAINPALDFLLPMLPQEEKKQQNGKTENRSRRNQQATPRNRTGVELWLLEKIVGIVLIIAGLLVAAASRRQPEFIIRFEFNSGFLLSLIGVLLGGYFMGKSAERREYLREHSVKRMVNSDCDQEKQW